MKPPHGLSLPTHLTPKAMARIGFGLLVLVAAIAGVGAVLREPIATFSSTLVADYGLLGLFGAVFAMDPVPGLGFQPALFLGYTGGIALGPLFGATWLASLSASVAVYTVGRAWRGRPGLEDFLVRWRIGHWLRSHGVRAIAIASVAPVPFGLATFAAGVMGVGLRDLLLGASFRAVKMALTLSAIVAGWGVSA
ncbi:MAG: hypothetical protein Q8P41_09420 [Pseudomonadota bacterium]|nr:hypothetical protein [Pseudomonadota bacterium]